MNPPREKIFNIPPVVLTLVALLALVHLVLAFALIAQQTNDILALFAFSPLRYLPGAVPNGLLPDWWGPQVWSFVSYALLHADGTHLIVNLVWLLAFGVPVARRLGAARFVMFCAATAIAGGLAHLISHWHELAPMIGASAAVSGAMAAAMRFVFQRGGPLGLLGSGEQEPYRVPAAPLTTMLRDPRALAFLAVWFAVNLLFGMGAVALPGMDAAVAWEAHIGGFLMGLFGFGLFDPVPSTGGTAEFDGETPSADDRHLNQ